MQGKGWGWGWGWSQVGVGFRLGLEWRLESLRQVGGIRLGGRRRPASEEPYEVRRRAGCRGVAYAVEQRHDLGGTRGDGGRDAGALRVRAVYHTVHGGGGERVEGLLALVRVRARVGVRVGVGVGVGVRFGLANRIAPQPGDQRLGLRKATPGWRIGGPRHLGRVRARARDEG